MDARFGGNDWESELSEALVSAYTADTSANAYHEISTMLEKLGDPFTRIVPPSCAPTCSSPFLTVYALVLLLLHAGSCGSSKVCAGHFAHEACIAIWPQQVQQLVRICEPQVSVHPVTLVSLLSILCRKAPGIRLTACLCICPLHCNVAVNGI